MAAIYAGKKGWTLAYRRWLTTLRFEHPAQQIVLQDYIHAVQDAEARVAAPDRSRSRICCRAGRWRPSSRPCRPCAASALIVAVTVAAEVGDFYRFANPRQLMAYLGLVPSEHSSGGTSAAAGSPRPAMRWPAGC